MGARQLLHDKRAGEGDERGAERHSARRVESRQPQDSGALGPAGELPAPLPLPGGQSPPLPLPHAGAAAPERLPRLPRGDRPATTGQSRAHQRVGRPLPQARGAEVLPLQAHRQEPGRHGAPQQSRHGQPADDEHLQLAEETHQTAHGRTARRRQLLGEDAQGREGRHVRPDAGQDQGGLPWQGGAPLPQAEDQGIRHGEGLGGRCRRERRACGLAALPAQTLECPCPRIYHDHLSRLAGTGLRIRKCRHLGSWIHMGYRPPHRNHVCADEPGGYRPLQLATRQTAPPQRHFQTQVQGRPHSRRIRHHGHHAHHPQEPRQGRRTDGGAGGLLPQQHQPRKRP